MDGSRLVRGIHLHRVVLDSLGALTLDLALDFIVVELVFALALDVDAAVLGHLLLLGAILVAVLLLVLVLDTGHLHIIAHWRCNLGGGLAFLDFFLLLSLLSTVFFAVGDEVGFGLLRGELGRCRGIGIPETCQLRERCTDGEQRTT